MYTSGVEGGWFVKNQSEVRRMLQNNAEVNQACIRGWDR